MRRAALSHSSHQKRVRRSVVVLASTQALSCACGFLLPMCPGVASWSAVMCFSLGMYFVMFPKWLRQRAAFLETRTFATTAKSRGTSLCETSTYVDTDDIAARVEISYTLLSTCVFCVERVRHYVLPRVCRQAELA